MRNIQGYWKYITSHVTPPADGDLRSLIAPSKPVERGTKELEEAAGSEEPPSRGARFLHAVTKTETETRIEYTATTAVTMKCTPAVAILPSCA